MLLKHISEIHAESRGTYGSPRVHAELTLGLGLPVNLKRVARLMRQAGIQGLYRRRRRGCTVRDPTPSPARTWSTASSPSTQPNRLWVTDITEHPTDGREAVLRRGHGRLFPADRRLVHRRPHAHRTGHRRARHGHHPPATRERPRARRSCIPTTARNTRRGRSGNDSRRPACSARWAPSATATTVRLSFVARAGVTPVTTGPSGALALICPPARATRPRSAPGRAVTS